MSLNDGVFCVRVCVRGVMFFVCVCMFRVCGVLVGVCVGACVCLCLCELCCASVCVLRCVVLKCNTF